MCLSITVWNLQQGKGEMGNGNPLDGGGSEYRPEMESENPKRR